MKQNQSIFHVIYLNLTTFFNGRKTLNYLDDFYNWHLSISLQKQAQTSKTKYNQIGHV